jgi:hypothetical protein
LLFITLKKGLKEKTHNISIMEQENAKKRFYECKMCFFETNNKCSFSRHLGTNKHLKNAEKHQKDDDSLNPAFLEMELRHAKEMIELQKHMLNLFAGTINKKAPKMPVMDICGNVVSDEEQEQEPAPEPKLKKEPEWTPQHTFHEIQQHYDSQFTFGLINENNYKKYDEDSHKDIKDYDAYIEEELGDKDEQTKFMNEYTCDSFQLKQQFHVSMTNYVSF